MRFGDLSTYAKNALLGHLVGKTAYPMPTAHLGLSTTDPKTAVTEPADAAYARVVTAEASWGDPANAKIASAADLVFPVPVLDWGAIAYWFMADAPGTGAGNVLGSGRLGAVVTRLNEDLASDDTSISVLDNSTMPSAGTIILEDEEVTYTGKGTGTLTGCTRGANGTTAKAHAKNHEVFLCMPKTVGIGDTVRFSSGKLIVRSDYTTG